MDYVYEKAPAKVNISLALGGLRSDGYHEIDTLMQAIRLSDELFMEKSLEPSLLLEGPFSDLPQGENIVWKSINILKERYGITDNVRITLVKNIPFSAGLAGGSSDAYAALRAFDRLFSLNLSFDEYTEISPAIGSDVVFFCYGGLARASGRGEILEPLPDPESTLLIIAKPDLLISTADAYSAWDAHYKGEPLERKDFHNDFERVIFPLYPNLQKIKERFIFLGCEHALLTGSGSCICGYCNDFERALSIMDDPVLNSEASLILTRTIGRYE